MLKLSIFFGVFFFAFFPLCRFSVILVSMGLFVSAWSPVGTGVNAVLCDLQRA